MAKKNKSAKKKDEPIVRMARQTAKTSMENNHRDDSISELFKKVDQLNARIGRIVAAYCSAKPITKDM